MNVSQCYCIVLFRVIQMKSKESAAIFLSLLGCIFLIVNNDLAVNGAIKGINLCINTIIPSLFPFLFLTNYIVSHKVKQNHVLVQTIGKMFAIPKGCEDLLIPILLGGYPVGILSVMRAYKQHRISMQCANKMLLYCNNPGPAFIFGILSKVFKSKIIPLQLWFIQILCCLTLSTFESNEESGYTANIESVSIAEIMLQSLRSVSMICGWVILFRILINYLQKIPNSGIIGLLKLATIGCIELSNGCISLASLPNSNYKFIATSTMLGFGGICVTMQSVSQLSDLAKKNYYVGKCLNAVLAAFYSTIFTLTPLPLAYILLAAAVIILENFKRKSRFSGIVRV